MIRTADDEKPTVLVVDDMPENLMVLGDLLQPDCLVRVANSGQRAVAVAKSAPQPDLILLDVMMPGMNGYAVLDQLRADPLTSHIPVIFVTAMDSDADEEKGLALGAVDFIHKPIKPAIVQARVRTQLELKAARDALYNRNLNLEVEVQRRIRENQLIQDVSMRALASLAETRDNETGNHIRRTQEYVRILAGRLRAHPRFAGFLTDTVIELLVKSAPLHDIGKVGVPDHILLKPGKLTDAEWTVMKSHSMVGARAIQRAVHDADRSVDFLDMARQIAYFHHEKWDGSGYPEGRKWNATPIPARLMALADVFDALISRRVYKPALPVEEARDVIVAERGRHFDPDVVDAFLAGFEEFVAVAGKYRESDTPRE